jgi:hypothetical protein
MYFTLPVPEEHTKDYDRAIRFISLDTREEIKLSEADAKSYVEDMWGWTASYLSNTSSYFVEENIEEDSD